MRRHRVHSTTIASAGHDPTTATLEIEFTDGDIYTYFMVPKATFLEFMAAESKGTFFVHKIKGVYAFKKANS